MSLPNVSTPKTGAADNSYPDVGGCTTMRRQVEAREDGQWLSKKVNASYSTRLQISGLQNESRTVLSKSLWALGDPLLRIGGVNRRRRLNRATAIREISRSARQRRHQRNLRRRNDRDALGHEGHVPDARKTGLLASRLAIRAEGDGFRAICSSRWWCSICVEESEESHRKVS